MGRSSQEKAQENRARILQNASQLFRQHGVENVSIADVMAACGMTVGGFYKHFASKQANASVCEVILSGVFKKPQLATLKPWAVMQLKEDGSNATACNAFLTAAEVK